MKNNKLKVLLLATCVALPTMFGLTACGHKHDFSANWLKDADSHWHVCSDDDCSEVSDKSTHTFVAKHDSTQYWQECSVCGQQSEKTTATVNETTLKNALEFKDAEGNYYTNAVAECEGSLYSNINVVKTVKFTNGVFYKYDSTLGTSTPKELIYSKETDDTKVIYSKMDKNSGWIKTTQSFSNNLQAYAKSTIFTGTSTPQNLEFTYDEESNTYSATTKNGSDDFIYTLKFANGKLVNIYVKRITTENVTNLDYTWTISYDTATIEIPSDLSYVGSAQWSKALSFDGVTNFTQTMVKRNSENAIERKITSQVTESSAYRMDFNAGGTNYNIYDLTNKKNYNKGSTGKYTKSDWANLTSFNVMLSYVGNPANLYTSIKDSFTDFTYNEDENVYYCASASIDGTTYQDVKLTFDNAKLVKPNTRMAQIILLRLGPTLMAMRQ